jgi:hypothetical protein
VTEACYRQQLSWALSQQSTEWVWESGQKVPKNTFHRLFVPTPRQVDYLANPAKNRLFGGAAGPGKSTAARMGLYRRALAIPGFEALILRETFPELERTHLRRMASEAEWFTGASFVESKRLLRFPNGSLIEAGHLEDEAAVRKYLSSEYDHIVADEGSQLKPMALLEISTRARTSKPAVLKAGGARFDVVSNPGGEAAGMLLDLFIDHQPDAEQFPMLAAEYDATQWAYIPATLDDNPYLDPSYVNALRVLQPWRYEQLRHGNWRVFHGQFFDWRDRDHQRSVEIREPKAATWFRALDWGYHDPCVVGWFVAMPDGHYHCVGELKLKEHTVDEVVREVKAMDRTLGLPTPISSVRTYADPATRQRGGQTGESILETFGKCGMPLIPSVNERKNGWMRVQALLKNAPDGVPWLTFAPECKYLRKCLSGIMSDEKDPDEVNEKQADLQHGLDMLRYFGMSRPMPTAPRIEAKDPQSVGAMLDVLIAESSRVTA